MDANDLGRHERITRQARKANAPKPYGYVVMLDKFMSGWGMARGGRSLLALTVDSEAEAYTVIANAQARSEMRRIRFAQRLPRLRTGDHLSVKDKASAGPWYRPGAFRRDAP